MSDIKHWKEDERTHYDSKAEAAAAFRDLNVNGSLAMPYYVREPFLFLDQVFEGLIPGKTLLDFGCGDGLHSIASAQYCAEVIGVDISGSSLQLAEKRRDLAGLSAEKVRFEKGDCTALHFRDSEFDLALSVGTLSSIPLAQGLDEVVRVLKDEGTLIGIDTLKYNPFARVSRLVKYARGLRTSNTLKGVFTRDSLEELGKRFRKVEFHYFQLFSLVGVALPESSWLQGVLRSLDQRLFALVPVFRLLAFKVVYICTGPIKVSENIKNLKES